MDPDLISIRAFAHLDGCDESLVRRAVKQGRLTLHEGKLPASLAGSAWRKRRPTKNKLPSTQSADNRADLGADTARVVRSSETIEQAAQRIADAAAVVPPLSESMAKKEHFLALLRELEYQEKSESLVSVDVARGVLFEGARTFRDALMHWPGRVAPVLASDLDVPADRVAELLTAQVSKLLASLSDPIDDFTGPT